jgi:hypothetical protein
METENKSAFNILKEFRDLHEKRATRAFITFLIFLGIFIIDVVATFAVNFLTLFGWVGVWCLILAMAFALKDYVIEKNAIKKIDSYYLKRLYEYENEKE